MNKRLQKVIDHPLHQQLGITDIISNQGRGSFQIKVDKSALNPSGALHGGVVFLLADVCAYAGLLSQLQPDQEAVTHDIHVSVMKPALLGDCVDFRSEVIRLGKRICFLEVNVSKGDSVLATARVTKSIVSVA